MINDITTDAEDGMKKAVDSFKRDLAEDPHRPREHRRCSTASRSTTTARRRR